MNRSLFKIFSVCIIILFLFEGCEKEATREFPRLKTLPVKCTTNGAILLGEILNHESLLIEDYGFIVGDADLDIDSSQVTYSINKDLISGSFEMNLESELDFGKSYFYMAYAKSNGITATGEKVSFMRGECYPPEPLDFYPESGSVGDTVKITCGNLAGSANNYIIRFNDKEAELISLTESEIAVIVPFTLNRRESNISIYAYGHLATFPKPYLLNQPVIDSIAPVSVAMGGAITIYGKNFNPKPYMNQISIGTTILKPGAASESYLIVSLDLDILTGIYSVGVETCGEYTYATESLIVSGSLWEKLSDFPGGNIYRGGGFSIGAFGYAGLGGDISHQYLSDIWKSSGGNNWNKIAVYPGGKRISPYCFTINNKAYVGGGFNKDAPGAVPFYDFYSYDPMSNTWSQIQDFPGIVTVAKYTGFSQTVGLKHYLYVGQDEFYKFNGDLLTWEKIDGACPAISNMSISFVISDIIYILNASGSFWTYNTITNSWIQKNDFPGPKRWAGFGCSLGRHGYIGLGNNGQTFFKDVWEYYPDFDDWIKYPDLPDEGRMYVFSFQVINNIYIGGGLNYRLRALPSVYKFSPE